MALQRVWLWDFASKNLVKRLFKLNVRCITGLSCIELCAASVLLPCGICASMRLARLAAVTLQTDKSGFLFPAQNFVTFMLAMSFEVHRCAGKADGCCGRVAQAREHSVDFTDLETSLTEGCHMGTLPCRV